MCAQKYKFYKECTRSNNTYAYNENNVSVRNSEHAVCLQLTRQLPDTLFASDRTFTITVKPTIFNRQTLATRSTKTNSKSR